MIPITTLMIAVLYVWKNLLTFTGDIGNLVFYGSDPVVTKIFGTNIKYAINFIPANTFNGKKSDFVFKLGENGLGYYYDGPKINL